LTTRVAGSSGDVFAQRHIGPREADVDHMLRTLGLASMAELVDKAVPSAIRTTRPLGLPEAVSEYELLGMMRRMAAANGAWRSFIGMGYHGCITPPVIQRNVLENPAWYTQYTPYQSEIAQGRLEALLNFQTAIIDLTGLPIANASLLDEATAAAEAMAMLHAAQGRRSESNRFFVDRGCHPQTIAVVATRARWRGWELVVGDANTIDMDGAGFFGALVQYPTSEGSVEKALASFCQRAHEAEVAVAVAADPLALALILSPGELGADVAVGSMQRFGMPMGFGGPHAAYFATREQYRRLMPGRIIGVARDVRGRPALRMALQTREQHIRREKATSNICTAQVLPAVVAAFYAIYHGPEGLRRIAEGIHELTAALASGAAKAGFAPVHDCFFDTVCLRGKSSDAVDAVFARAEIAQVNMRRLDSKRFSITLDETTSQQDVADLLAILGSDPEIDPNPVRLDADVLRKSEYLTHEVFHRYRSETEMLRYMRRLDGRDLSLTTSMIPLGSCTMKLNATVEMMPITWPGFATPHPFAPLEQSSGYVTMFRELESMLAEITGMHAVSLQPNAGSQGEYAGLLAIRRYQEQRGEAERNICLIPASAHGTNPASAVMAGLDVVVVACDDAGNIDLEDLGKRASQAGARLAALMVTYPSTHGVFEEEIRTICDVVHAQGGMVYMDGANMNAMVGLCRPGEFGVDVCHLNLHKTFCIPHGGGGPGMGPIAVNQALTPFLPGHPLAAPDDNATGAVSAAPYSSAVILLISWAYLRLMGPEGLTRATQAAMLNANYVAHRLDEHFPVLYRGRGGMVAHEAICDLRSYKKTAGIEVDDVAKRLMDYGYHAPTVHFPVPGTVMIEPTESESLEELDRFCHAMIAIRQEIAQIETGEQDRQDNPLKQAPHTVEDILADDWARSYSRETAARPAAWLHEHKFWPAVGRIDNAFGDRQLVCHCLPVEAYIHNTEQDTDHD
jgi:glycine dehydrogenase